MQLMKNLALNIRTLADEAGDFEIIAEMEDHIKDYNKNLWMLSAMTK